MNRVRRVILFFLLSVIIVMPVRFRTNASTKAVGTPINYHQFSSTKGTVTYYLDSSIPSAQKNLIRSGFSNWSYIGNLVVSESSGSSAADIVVYVTNKVSAYPNALGVSYFSPREIYFCTDNIGSNSQFIIAACHEMGHQLGLGHNILSSASVMKADIANCASYPQYADVLTIQELYPF